MNRRERDLLVRLQECLHSMTGLGPTNPCDTGAIFAAYGKYQAASRELFFAMTNIGFGDYSDADARLRTAEGILHGD